MNTNGQTSAQRETHLAGHTSFQVDSKQQNGENTSPCLMFKHYTYKGAVREGGIFIALTLSLKYAA